jgi:hypothetical protein
MRHLLLIVLIILLTVGCSTNSSYNNDSVVANKDSLPKGSIISRYVPLPCAKRVELEKLYGTWRSIGDEYNDATYKYWINKIDTAGNWFIDKVDSGRTMRKYSGKVISINKKDYTIEVKGDAGITTLEILNLTENCFEYRHKASKQVWRLDRFK